MATNDERTLRNVLEKLELLTGERSDGSRRAVLISELNGIIQDLSEQNAAVKKAVRELTAEFNASNAFFKEEILVRADENSALSQIITTLKAQVGANIAQIEDTKRALATSSLAMAEKISILSAQVGSAQASIIEETRVRVTETEATAEKFLEIESTFNGQTASITESLTTIANAQSTTATKVATLESNFNSQQATITNFQQTYADDKVALAQDITRIEATAGKKRSFRQATAPANDTTNKLIVGDLWFDTDDNNKPYYWTGSSWQSVQNLQDLTGYALTSSVTQANAARATADMAMAQALTQVSAGSARVYTQTTAPSSSGRINGDVWYDSSIPAGGTAPIFKPYVWYNGAWQDNTSGAYTKYVGRHATITQSMDSYADTKGNLSTQWAVRATSTGNQFGGLVLTSIQKAGEATAATKFEIGAETYIWGHLHCKNSQGQTVFSTYPNQDRSTYMISPLIKQAEINADDYGAPAIESSSFAQYGHGIKSDAIGANATGILGQGKLYGVEAKGVTFDFYASGTAANYGPFTGSHDALILPSDAIDVGDIVVDAECLVRRGISSTLFRVVKSASPNQKAVVGVLAKAVGLLANAPAPAIFDQTPQRHPRPEDGSPPDYSVPPPPADNEMTPIWNAMKDNYVHVAVNALGEGQINVCGENGDIEPGDLIVTSSIPGKGMKQADDIVRGYTVAKAREGATFASPSEVKMIACIYLSG